jgi:hypothetical protein
VAYQGCPRGTADRPDDPIVGDQRVERCRADPDQPNAWSRWPLLRRQASPQGPAGQELVCAAHALDEHHAIVAIASSGIPLQQPSLKRPVDRLAQHHVVPQIIPEQPQPRAPLAACVGYRTDDPPWLDMKKAGSIMVASDEGRMVLLIRS